MKLRDQLLALDSIRFKAQSITGRPFDLFELFQVLEDADGLVIEEFIEIASDDGFLQILERYYHTLD